MNYLMNYLFNLICYFHVFIWVFIALAFLDKKMASINLYYVIPFIYIIHILPFHILCKLKENIDPKESEKKFQEFKDSLYKDFYILVNYDKTKEFFNFSIFNPLSPQGMLIFGAITSAYTLK